MKLFAPLLSLVALSAGCVDRTDAAGANPATLWLATDGSELRVHLVPVEPDPF